MAIIDVILYNGERDIFDLRYNILKDFVDEFIVCEFSKTFSGKDKESHPINLPKVSYHFFTQWKDFKPDMPEAFQREYNQREIIRSTLTHLDDDDIVYFGDCDEIPDPIQNYPINVKLKLKVYSYYLNNRSDENFKLGTLFMRYGDMRKYGLNDLRSNVELTDDYFGWHFTNMGGLDKLKYKIDSYGHQEFNVSHVTDHLEERIANNQDYIGRDFKFWVDESDWPPWLKDNREKFAHLLK